MQLLFGSTADSPFDWPEPRPRPGALPAGLVGAHALARGSGQVVAGAMDVLSISPMSVVVNTNGAILGGFPCTTHFRTYFSGDWDVHWGYGTFCGCGSKIKQEGQTAGFGPCCQSASPVRTVLSLSPFGGFEHHLFGLHSG